jgi:DNA-binding transcriptional ArsR family regulator
MMSVSTMDPGRDARTPAETDILPVRRVSDVEGLKALADPIRLHILRVMSARDLPVMSVKELAEQLSEPQTKLYRHVKVLEAAGLIHVAATRLVSGIVEQRYQASQRDVIFHGPGLSRPEGADESAEAAVAAVLDNYRQRLFTAARTGQLPAGELDSGEPYRSSLLMLSEGRVSRERAAAARLKLQEVLDELGDADDDPGGVPVNVLIGFFSPVEEP